MRSPVVWHIAIAFGVIVSADPALAQRECRARMEQDPGLDNLAHPSGYRTAPPDSLGRVKRAGEGDQAMILIAGAGFGGEIFDGFMEDNRDRYTMYAVTLAGFGGTPAPPMPPPGVSYGEQTWTRGARRAVRRLIEQENLKRPVIVGHWLTGTQVALALALDDPDLVGAVILISGVPKIIPTGAPDPPTLKDRVMMVDNYVAPQWFKTVTPETWHDNNFLPRDYATHPLRALQLWRQAAAPPLPVWIRYLVELWAQDVTLDLGRLALPTLVIIPGFDDDFFAAPIDSSYMRSMCQQPWADAAASSPFLTIRTIDRSRVFIMEDQPETLNAVVSEFLTHRPSQPEPEK